MSKATILRTEGLTKRFGGLITTNRVNFELKEGEIKALIGPNGAGKTTFYNLITGVYKPDEGRITFMDEDITRLPPHEICKKGIARTFQITSIFPKLTVYENVRLAAQVGFGRGVSAFRESSTLKEVNEHVANILEAVGLAGLRDRVSAEISQGDQRLEEVAIALGSRPKLLLLDEPTAGLSATETWLLVEKIKELYNTGIIKNIIFVEHDLEVVTGLAHNICVLNYGEVVKDGCVDDVCNDPGVQEVYLAGGKVSATEG
jgi:branched-chain amino acid transport system ATP-binding protein